MKRDPLEIDFLGIKMRTPVMTGSGTFGYGPEYSEYVDLSKVGAVVVKGITPKPRAGNKGCRIAETPSGMLNSIGLENPGVDEFIKTTLPQISGYNVPIIVNVSANSVEEYGEMAAKLSLPQIAALEVNISCPNLKCGGMAFGADCLIASEVVRAVKKNTKLPIITKLTPNVTDITAVAKSVEDAGSDAISLINTLLGMVIDTRTWKPVLGNVMGGLSGPAVKPVAVRMVYQVAKAVKVPIVGMGGIMTGEDAVEFMLAGASAVSVGTANFINPRAAETVGDEMREYLAKRNLSHISEIVGKVQVA